MKVLVCGGRHYQDREKVFEVLDQLHAEREFTTVIEGEARGADTLAKTWAMLRSVMVEPYPANWTEFGKAAGPIRNRQMLTEGKPELVVAFFDVPYDESRGTRNMVEQSRKAGLEVITVEP